MIRSNPVPTYRTAPLKTEHMPPGIPHIIGNEAAERFSFYGMKAILVMFMTKYMLDATGKPDQMTDTQATVWLHTFNMAVYFTPLFGAMLADAFLGKYKTIIWLSIVYCLGHLALAIDQTRMGLLVGLTLIAIGSGGIKPCVSAHVGDQFGETNKKHLPRVYSWFYFSINFGAFFSMALTPWLLKFMGPHWAFGIPGVFMAIATFVFWMGRHRFAHIPPAGISYFKETFSMQGLGFMIPLIPLYLCLAMFWALFDQTFSSWVIQAGKMDLFLFGKEIIPAQVLSANSLLIVIFIPIFSYLVYPAVNKVYTLTPLRKIGIGMFITVLSFLVTAWIEAQITQGGKPNISWQLFAYVLLTAAEIMVSITFLEFSYTQAPNRMKSLIMSFYLLSVAAGNAFTALVNAFIQNPDGSVKLQGASYFLFFAGTMLATAIIFTILAWFYKERSYVQKEQATA